MKMDREIPESIQSQLRIEELPPTPVLHGFISHEQAKDLDQRDIPILTVINQQARYIEYYGGVIQQMNKQLRYLEYELIRRRTNAVKMLVGLLTAFLIAAFSAWLHSVLK